MPIIHHFQVLNSVSTLYIHILVYAMEIKYCLNTIYTSPSASIESVLFSPFPPPRILTIAVEYSIIAIQGLWANPQYTWQYKGTMWLRDLLPRSLPNVSVLTFEPVFPPPTQGSQLLHHVQKVLTRFLLVLGFLTILCYSYQSLRTLLVLLDISTFSILLIIAFRKAYKRLTNTPTSEIRDQAEKLVECLKERREKIVSSCIM